MARPRKEPSEKLTGWIPGFRCHPEQAAAIKARAEAANLSVSAYVREQALHGQVVTRETLADAALVTALNRIGSNLNQLTRKIHIREDDPELWERLDETHHQIAELIEGLVE